MSRQNPEWLIEKKKASLRRLAERYYGKKDLLETWDEHPGKDHQYRRELARRVHAHKEDIRYRGGDCP